MSNQLEPLSDEAIAKFKLHLKEFYVLGSSEANALLAEVERLRGIVATLPVTVDGVTMALGSEVVYDNLDRSLEYVLGGDERFREMTVISLHTLGDDEIISLLEFGSSVSTTGLKRNCYSTRAAASAALAAGEKTR